LMESHLNLRKECRVNPVSTSKKLIKSI